MAHLTNRNLQKLQECVREIYSDLNLDEWHSRLLSVIAKIIPSNVITYNKIDPLNRKNIVYYETPLGYFSPKDAAIHEKYMHEHPGITLYPDLTKSHPFKKNIDAGIRKISPDLIRHPVGRTLKISDLLTNSQFRSLGLYNEFFRKYDVEYQIGMVLSYRTDTGEGIAISRDGKDFTERDRLILNLLAPHIIQAYKNAEAYKKARQTFAALEDSKFSLKAYGLTYREEDVLYWVAQGKTNAETAGILKIAPGTVKIHLEKIYQKLGVENRTAASALAMGGMGGKIF